jgi:hypothetical protein
MRIPNLASIMVPSQPFSDTVPKRALLGETGQTVPAPDGATGSVSAVGFHTCSSPLGPVYLLRVGLVFTLRATDLPWHVNFLSYNPGVVTGIISHLRIVMSNPGCFQMGTAGND